MEGRMKEVDGVPESPHEPSGTDIQSLNEPQLDRNGDQSPIDESQTTVPCVNSSKDNLSSTNGSSTQQLNHSPSQPHPTFPLPSSNSSSSQQMWEQRSKLFIGGLTVNTTDQMLNHYFAKFGEVIDAVVMKDRATARSRGFGFVTFRDPEMLNAAQASRPHEIDGKQVETKRAMPREDSANPESHVTVNKIFCGAIKREVTEVEVREYFSRFGRVTECELVHRRDTGESRGFAFITFDDYDPVDQILLARPHLLGGKTVDVRKALTRDQQVELKQKQQHQLASRQHSTGGLVASHGNYLPSSNPLQAATVLHSTFYCSPTSVNPGVGSGAPSAHHHHQHHHHQSLHHSPATSLDAATALSPSTAAALLSPNYPMAAAAFSAMFSQAGAFGPSQYNPLLHNPASLTSYPPSPHAMSAVPSAGATTHLLNNAAAAAWMNAVTNSGSASTPTSPLLTSWPLLDGGASLYGSPLSPVAFFNPFNGMCYAPTLSAAAPHNTAFSTATFHQHSEAPAPVFPSAAAPVENGTTTSAPLATPVNGSKVSSTQKATETAVIPAKEKISVGENDRAEPVENGTAVEVDGLASDVESRLTCSPNKDL